MPVKLFLLVLVPMVLIAYLALEIYREKKANVTLIRSYVEGIREATDISTLVNSLQLERRYSYEFALKRDSILPEELIIQRLRTDSIISRLDQYKTIDLKDFRAYTFLHSLDSMRSEIDSMTSADMVMHFFTTAIFRLKTLTAGNGSNTFIDPVYKELVSGRILNEMSTYLGIIRANFYNALYNKINNVPMLYGLLGTYDVYKSYETEFLIKSSPELVEEYNEIRQSTELLATRNYIDTIFRHFSFDTLYEAEDWWLVSGVATDKIKRLQAEVMTNLGQSMENTYAKEIRSRNWKLVFLIIALCLVLLVMAYTTHVITQMLSELNRSAKKIAEGDSPPPVKEISRDVMGSLALSIGKIDENNKMLTKAASAIGKGEFNIAVHPRGEKDVLGHAIVKMKENLQQFTKELEEAKEQYKGIAETAQEHERRKDDFIIIASHELKTPITSIKGYVQLLTIMFNEYEKTRNLPSESSVRSSLHTIEKQVNKLARLLSELLDISRMESGKMELNKTVFNLNELIAETIEEVQLTAPDYEIKFSNAPSQMVYGDRDRIAQVILNLLSNAVKYSPNKKNIEVDLHDNSNGEVIVSVKDEGIGIARQEHQKIFGRFYRVEGKSEQTYPGFGIGLYIAYEIIHRHNGTLSVVSEKGKGSVFSFSLPKEEPVHEPGVGSLEPGVRTHEP